MKKYIAGLLLVVAVVACKNEVKNEAEDAFAKADKEVAAAFNGYAQYGGAVVAENVVAMTDAKKEYATMKVGDTLDMTLKAPINSVCAKKGCWIRLNAGEEEEVFVKFKDYGFFVPLDADGEAIVQGKAFVEEVAVEELKHMAEDAGKTSEEIAAITVPKKELRFLADGVLIKGK